ncbi:hypothetical protein RJ639_021183 [Escallonia herrerae]|uniref:GEX2 N-terminal Ig-like domain-containing protein n=1 Tax=Escallonia herrerae TaxID=1293975 RepID=A0AA89AGN4_9ASTE|nr:hypothetical protein RJ639_021183 [Escallonia herrerae]
MIVHKIISEGIKVDEQMQVAAIIDKLPNSWKEFQKGLRHKQSELSIVNLMARLQIEEEARKQDKKNEALTNNTHANHANSHQGNVNVNGNGAKNNVVVESMDVIFHEDKFPYKSKDSGGEEIETIESSQPSQEAKNVTIPTFAFSWLDDKDNVMAGDIANIKVKVLGNFEADKYKYAFNPNISVDDKMGNSCYVSGVVLNFGGDLNNWRISFIPIMVGLHNVLITDDHFKVFDSSLHFRVTPGVIYPAAGIVSWVGQANEFVAGTKAAILVLPKDAFGNNVSSTSDGAKVYNFTVSTSYVNGSSESVLNITNKGWNKFGYLSIGIMVATAGDLLLHVEEENQTLSGSPLLFKGRCTLVSKGTLDVPNCVLEWTIKTKFFQLFSMMKAFIHQRDKYGNLVPGFFEFDVEVIEKETNLSMPISDLLFEEVTLGIQVFSFRLEEPGDFMLLISDKEQNHMISNMPYQFTVYIGYCDGVHSIINGSGLNNSVAGESSKFSVFLRDAYQYPSPVELEKLQVQILQRHESMKQSGGEVRTSAYDVVYMPEKSGTYEIRVSCGNIPLNAGQPFRKEVNAGEVNASLSRVVDYAPKVPKLIKNKILVELRDSFSNPVMFQQSKLKLDISSINKSEFSTWGFVDNKNGSYTGSYRVKDVGTYEICASLSGKHVLPCPFGVNVYSSEHFPKAYNDAVSVWEDESISFNSLQNDYFAGNASVVIAEFSKPVHGSLLQYGHDFRYTPYKGFYGNDSFTYTISDVNGNLASAAVNISILLTPPQFVSFPSQLLATEDALSPRFGDENFCGNDTIRVSTMNKNGRNDLDVPIFVEPVNDPPFINVPEFIILEEKRGEAGTLIFNRQRDKFDFCIGDPDLLCFPGNKSHFLVMFSVEVNSGFLSTNLPAELISTTELKLKNSYQWQPLQTFVTISKHFMVKAKGVRFWGTVNDCNSVMQQLSYYGGEHGSILTIEVNDMGRYGCYPDCAELMSVPIFVEATVNLIRRRPMSSLVAHTLGTAIVIEFIFLFSLGVLLLFFMCKCAMVLIHEKRRCVRQGQDIELSRIQHSNQQTASNADLPENKTRFTGCCSSPFLFSGQPSNFRQRSRRRPGNGASSSDPHSSSQSSGDHKGETPVPAAMLPVSEKGAK